jgi:hypothetical protein
MHNLKYLLIVFIFIGHLVHAQKDKEEDTLPFIKRQDSLAIAEVKLKKIKFTPFLAPALSPEVGLMLTGGGLISFTVDRSDKLLQPSSIPFSFGYSTSGAAILNIRPSIFFKNDKNRVSGDIWMKDMPDNYWGVGYEAAKSPSEPDSTTNYWRNWWQVNLKYVHQFRSNFFAGALFDYNRTDATNLSQTIREDPNIITDGTLLSNWSIGLLLQYDSRDLTVNAYDGVFVELSSNFYQSDGFGRPNYQILIIDYRQYEQIRRPGNTLAWQIKTRIGSGDVPWPEMSQIGTPFDLRGYRWGRYRDKNMLFGIVEYRYMFMRKTPRKDGNMVSRFGVVPWLATGSIATDFADMTHWLPNGGIGLRFEIQKRMNARIDYGIGNDTAAFYISFNEAF